MMDISTTLDQLQTHLLPPEHPSMVEATEVHENDKANDPQSSAEARDDRPLDPTEEDEIALSTAHSTDDAWYRNPYQITAMISNFSTSYNVVNISLVLAILQQLTESSSKDQSACASSLLAGMIVGQLVGGALGDSFLGRFGALNLVMGVQIVASLASACLSTREDSHLYVKLALWRFLLGVGAGGVYPLAAVLSAEQGTSNHNQNNSSNHHDQVHRVVLTFGMQGLGFIAVPLVAVPLLYCTSNLNAIWRILLGLGSVPGLCLMILRWRLVTRAHIRGAPVRMNEPTVGDETDSVNVMALETTANTSNQESDGIMFQDTPEEIPAARSSEWWAAIQQEPGLGGKLLGTAGTWFLFDVLFYGNTLFQPIVVEAAFGSATSGKAIQILQKTAVNSLILASIALPGYAVAGLMLGKRTLCVTQTPRYVMLQGFAAMSILYFTIGSNWSYLRHYPTVLLTLYGMTFFFANYGPNTTTFILPSLMYSPECRSTWNGISAASGKLGALVGATLFAPAADAFGDDAVMVICSGVAVVALVITWWFVPKEDNDPRHQPLQQENTASDDVVPSMGELA
jgi:MFS transporter, PHS family, inorganic phosphate transporter